MAPVANYAPNPPPIAGNTNRVTSPALGGRRKMSAPTKPVVYHQHQPSKQNGDAYYGYEEVSVMCGKFITDLFSCPAVPLFASSAGPASPTNCPPLANFIAYAIHRTRLPEVVVYTALFLLSRLKDRFPAARGSSGHRLFISAFMIASKVICDDTYSNKSWCIVGQNLYTLKEVNQMEREMCSYLEWILHVEANELKAFEEKVKASYGPKAGPDAPKWSSTSAAVAVTAVAVAPASATAPAPVTVSMAVEPTPATAAAAPVCPADSYPSPQSSASPPTPTHSDDSSPESSDEPLTPDQTDAMSIAATGAASISSLSSVAAAAAAGEKQQKPIIAQQPHIAQDPSFAFAGPTVW